MDQSKSEADARFIKDQTGFSSFESRSLIQLLSCASSYTRRPFSKYGLLNWPIASFVLWRDKVHILVCAVFLTYLLRIIEHVTETRKRKSHSWLEKKLTWISMRWSKYTDLRFWKCEAAALSVSFATFTWKPFVPIKWTDKWKPISYRVNNWKILNLNLPQSSILKWSFPVGAAFKWLSKVISRLPLLRLVIGLKKSCQFFNQWEAKSKPIAPWTRDFSRALSKLQVIARNSDWFIALFAPVVIGRSNCHGFGFSTIIWKPIYLKKFDIKQKQLFCKVTKPHVSVLSQLWFAGIVGSHWSWGHVATSRDIWTAWLHVAVPA